jgi:5'-nucleotidase
MKSNILLFDLDETLANYSKALLRDYSGICHPDEPKIDLLSDDEHPSFVKDRIKLIRSQRDWWLNLEVLPLGFAIYEMAREMGFDIHILTKGPWTTPHAWTEKVLWVRKHLNSDTKIHITEDKSLVYGKVLVDDYPKYISAWLNNRPRGLVIMPDHHHNRKFHHPSVIRAESGSMLQIEQALIAAKDR